MIGKIKTLIKTIKQIDKINRSNNDAFAMQFILKLFPEFSYLPFTPFSLNPFTILHILNDILFNDRKQIVEFGCGISTIIISRFIKVHNLDTQILSFDNNSNWIHIITKELNRYQCNEQVKLVHVELQKHNSFELKKYDNEYYYNLEIVKKNINLLKSKIDLVIVDGPSTDTSKYIRYAALPVISNYLGPSYCLFLDDTKRSSENKILLEWNKTLKGNIQFKDVYGTIIMGSNFSTNPLTH